MVCKFVVILIQISTVAGQIASKYQISRDISTISPYPTTGPDYKFLLGKLQTQNHGQTSQSGRERRLSPYKPFPPDLLPTLGPYLTPGPGYTYPTGRNRLTQYPGQTYPPPYMTPGPGYTYPPGKVPTQYPGQTYPPGLAPTLSPYKPFPPDLLPTLGPYLTPGPGYTYPPGKDPTQYPGQTYQPGKEPTLSPYKPFPPLFWPAIFPYLTPGPGYTIPPGKVPPTLYPGQILPIPTQYPGQFPMLSPYIPFPPGYFPTALWYSTPGPGVTYFPGKVPTQYPGQTYPPGQAPTVPPYKQYPSNYWPLDWFFYKPFPPDLRPTLGPYLTPGPGYTYPPGKVPTTSFPGEIPTLPPYQPFPKGLEPTMSPYRTPGPGYTYPPGRVPTQYPGQTFAPGKAPTLRPYLPFPLGLGPTPGSTNAPTKKPYLMITTAIPGISSHQSFGVHGYKVSTESSLILPSYETFQPDLPFTAFFKPLGPYTRMTLKPGTVTSLYTELGRPPTVGSVLNLTPKQEHITPNRKVLTEYLVTFPPSGKEPSMQTYKPFPPDLDLTLLPTVIPYATPGGNMYRIEKVPTPYPVTLTSPPPGKDPAVGYTYSQPDFVPTFRQYATPGILNLYPKEKVPTPYPVVVTSTPPGKEPSMQTYKPFHPDLLPTSAAYWTPAIEYTYPPPKKKPTYYRANVKSTTKPAIITGQGGNGKTNVKSTTKPAIITGQGGNGKTNVKSTTKPAIITGQGGNRKTNVKSTTKPAIITGQGGNGGFKGVCIFASVSYKQGQQWYDSCSSICVCEDASTGSYKCQPRCSKNDGVPKGCSMVPDPKDPLCCQIPDCSFALPDIFPTPSNRITKLAPTTLDWFAEPIIIIALSILASVMLIAGIALIVQYFRLRKKLPKATTYLPADKLKVKRNIENYETTDMKHKLIFIDEI
ncbi:uncharacterized protein LOC143080960 isoform X2 [Mytilus galloprovincialis]|uniref:uncharacterized protein LOC143080960 isoform X2 n=1 Tax=Mytilus galloprovincialis TaxID=29158 RepID=UPI003F7C9783